MNSLYKRLTDAFKHADLDIKVAMTNAQFGHIYLITVIVQHTWSRLFH